MYGHLKQPTNTCKVNFWKIKNYKRHHKKKHRVRIPLQRGGETNNKSAKIYGGKKKHFEEIPF